MAKASAGSSDSDENPQGLEFNLQPELVFGLVGPIGVDMKIVQNQLVNALKSVGYDPLCIRVTTLMRKIPIESEVSESDDPLTHYESRIDYANAVREACGNDAALAGLAILEIKALREKKRQDRGDTGERKNERPIKGTAYVIRQFKRKEEIELLRRVYGRKFVQVSVHLSQSERRAALANDMAQANPSLTPEQCHIYAQQLIKKDLDQSDEKHGQRIEEVFYLGDVFVNARNEKTISSTMFRFIDAFFGKNSLSPTKDEYGAYIASSASLRSLDISRQVGAAIFSSEGEVISLGCNEVPTAGGGTYWADHLEPRRDFEKGGDANRAQKNRIAYDFLKRLFEKGYLNLSEFNDENFQSIMSDRHFKDSMISDITEFGRMTHAEMSAMLDAARLGRSIKGATLFCTTFPCHNCAKHIIASGIKKVIFIEPYPKSQALQLHDDAIVIDDIRSDRVEFHHFVGISPRRYRDIFEKISRKGKNGRPQEWYLGAPSPSIEDRGPAYIYNETSAINFALAKVSEAVDLYQQPNDNQNPPSSENHS